MKITLWDKLQAMSYEVVQNYINTGDSLAIPADVKKYIEQLDCARGLYSKYKSKTFIVNTLTTTFEGITRYTAEMIYYDSINFFNLNNSVKKEAWKNFYADKLENAALVAWEQNDFKTYNDLITSAAKMRGVFDEEKDELPASLKECRTIIITTQPKDVGIEPANRNELASLIDGLDMTELAKRKARIDAQVTDVDIFEEDVKE